MSEIYKDEELEKEIREYDKHSRYSGFAKRIEEKVKEIKGKVKIAERRWFWELLQNASDYNDKREIDIEINLFEDKIDFKHNGNPFTYRQAMNLIQPDSDKDEFDTTTVKETIGQFGTGFLATHILSLLITVEGVIKSGENYYKFDFQLDRTGKDNKNKLIEGIKKSVEKLNQLTSQFIEKKINDFTPNEDKTTLFSYNFNEKYDSINGFDIAKHGIDNLEIVLPYVFAFMNIKGKNLNSVDIIDNTEKKTITYKNELLQNELDRGFKIFEVCKIVENVLPKKILIATQTIKNTTVALQIEKQGDRFAILPFDNSLPKLFKLYPLVGTENFSFPVIVHSDNFKPMTERQGIEILPYLENQQSLKEAVTAYSNLVEYACEQNWTNLFNICKVKPLGSTDEDDNNWYREEIIKDLKQTLVKFEIIETTNERKKLIDIIIPYAEGKENSKNEIDEIYRLAKPFCENKLPKFEHLHNWVDTISFADFPKLKYDLETFLKDISSSKKDNSTNLATLESSMIDTDSINWLSKVISFLCSIGKKNLLNETNFAILPNQNGNFKTLASLDFDDKIPEPIKDALELLQFRVRDNLLNGYIATVITPERNFTNDKAVAKIDEQIKKMSSDLIKNKADSDSLINWNKYSPNKINQINANKIRIQELKNINLKLETYLENAMFYLVGCMPENHDAKRKYIYKVTDDLFRDRLTKKEVLSDFNYWSECDKLIIRRLASQLAAQKSIFVLAKHLNEETPENEYEESTVIWLDDFLFFLNGEEEGATIFKNYNIFPNQHGNFKYNNELDRDDDIPGELKNVLINLDKSNDYYEKLMFVHKKMTQSKNLIEGRKRDKDRIAGEIELAFQKFDSNQRHKPNFVNAVTFLLDWIDDENEKWNLFPIFNEKQAEYVVATLGNAEERKAVLNIVKNGLATTFNLLFSTVGREQFNEIVENASEFSLFLEQKNQFDEFLKLTTNSIDDEVHADLQVGNIGEDIVYNDLLSLFDNDREIVKKVNEREYDFEIWNNTKTAILFYVDAKTTMRGIANSNSIPFFMRKSQWEFLDLDEAKNKYFIARVFKNRISGDVKIKYLKINSEMIKK